MDDYRNFDDVMSVTSQEQAKRKDEISSKYKFYDFKKKIKLSLEQEKFLLKIFEKFAELLQSNMGRFLQSKVIINLHPPLKIKRYQDFIDWLPDPSCLAIFKITPEIDALINFEFPVSFALFEKLLGGKGQAYDEIRSFTEIEIKVFEKIISKFLDSYSQAWEEVTEIIPSYLGMEFNPMAVHIAGTNDDVVLIALDFKISHVKGIINLIIPYKHLKEAVPNRNFEEFLLTKSSQMDAHEDLSPIFSKNIHSASVSLSVEVGATEMPFQDVLCIEVGDFIKLDNEIQSPIKVKINSKTKFLGKPGTKDNLIAIQITKVLTEEDEEFEQ